MMYPATHPVPANQLSPKDSRGFSLIASLVILIVLTILMVAMMRSAISQDSMTGNTREKTRALRAAESAIDYAEWWIKQSNTSPVSCSSGQLTQPTICDDAVNIVHSAKPPLNTWTEYEPSSDTTYWQTDTQGGRDRFYRNPGYHIQHLYTSPDGKADYYQITAYGYGGNSQAVAVTQTLFQITYSGNQITNLGG